MCTCICAPISWINWGGGGGVSCSCSLPPFLIFPLCSVHWQGSAWCSLNPSSLILVTFHVSLLPHCPCISAWAIFPQENCKFFSFLALWHHIQSPWPRNSSFFLPPLAIERRQLGDSPVRQLSLNINSFAYQSSQSWKKSAGNYFCTNHHVFLESRALAVFHTALFLSSPAGS